jgi:hypothetical protein
VPTPAPIAPTAETTPPVAAKQGVPLVFVIVAFVLGIGLAAAAFFFLRK